MQHSELQFDFPKFVPPQPPEWLVWLSRHLGWLRWVAPYIGYVMWAIVIAALAMVLFLIIRSLIRRGFFSWWRTKEEKPPESEWRPTSEAARLLLSDADKLAAEGRYADAIHLILLRSIEDISRHRPTALKPALTSREIGRLEALPLAAREAFAHIAAVSEHAIFAGREVGQREYAECRAAYERFAFPDVWSMKRAA
jgi:hypothetical protein